MNKRKSKLLGIIAVLAFSLGIVGCSEITSPQDTFPPETPKNFTLLGGGDGQAYFRWERNTEIDLKGYNLYRSENNLTSFRLIVTLSQTEYVDRFLNYDSTYNYYLTAIDNAGNESLPTNIIEVQPLNTSPPQPASRLNVSGYNNPSQGIKQIQLSWLPPDIGDLKNYLIYRGPDSNFTPNASTFIDSSNIAAYIDNSVQINQQYYYKIVAVDKGLKISLPSKSANDLILSSPTLVSPSNNSRFVNPKIFQFQGVPNAVSYVVFVGNGPFSDVIWSSAKTTDTQVAYGGPTLQSSKIYYWWVAAYSKDKVTFDDGSEIPSQINSYSLVNSFFGE
jgi:hypothetical protein